MSATPLNPATVRFEDLPEQAWPRQEIIDGSLHVTPLAGVDHQIIVDELTAALRLAVPKDLRVLPGVNVLRRSSTDRLLIPDVAVVDAEAARQAAAVKSKSLPPEDIYLAVEVISPSSRVADLILKKDLYAEWEIGSYWVVDPDARAVHEYGPRTRADTWLADVDLAGIWPDRDRPD